MKIAISCELDNDHDVFDDDDGAFDENDDDCEDLQGHITIVLLL